jgi:HK97 family phage portal protein
MPLLKALRRPHVKLWRNALPASSLAPVAAWQAHLRPDVWETVWTDQFPWHYVTEEEALDLPVVAGFMQITSSLLLQMPLHGYRKLPNGRQEPVDIDPPILLNPTPGDGRTFTDFITEYLSDMMLYGNYVAILGPPNAQGWPDVMVPIPVGQWQIITDGNEGAFHYLINGIRYEQPEVFHVMMNKSCSNLVGRGALQLYRRLIASSVAAERWAALYFEGGAVPPGVVEHPNPDLTPEQAALLKAKMKQVAMAREWAVVPGGTKLSVLDGNAEESQLNETRRMNAQQLAMAMGIPGALLGLDSPSLTYRNITDVFQQFLTTTVMAYVVPLEQQLSLQCLPHNQEARFFQANVLRPDMAARVQLANEAMGSGLFTRDEARAFFDLGAIKFMETSDSPLPDTVQPEEVVSA